jgi:TrmH family RNA methyltransferase
LFYYRFIATFADMISKNKIKAVKALELKKNRVAEGCFIAEGPKVVGDLMATFKARTVVATREWLDANRINGDVEVIDVTDDELKKVSLLQHPQQVLAVFEQRNAIDVASIADTSALTSKLSLALDGVQDPGNMGTIIRIADWFGIENIFCSEKTVDAFNPKVVQATMGSLARVNIVYTDIARLIDSLPKDFPVYGTLLDGEDLYAKTLSANGLIVMGNEGNGISQEIRKKVNNKLLIPNYPKGRETADSLNVAIATAITCAEFRRRG